MKRVLITGSSGFIGSRLAIRCRESGHDVTATSRRPDLVLEEKLGVPVRQFDVLDESAAADLFHGTDILIHCATANDILSRDFGAGVTLSVNGTRNVLEMAVKNGVRDVIFFSTLQVYGTELEGVISESTPTRCESPYGLNHLMGEEVCRMYANKYGLNVALVRPANVYGVPDSPTVERSTLVPMCFVKTALAGGPLVLQSSGRQRRNFVSTDEVADVCLHLIENFPSGVTVVNSGSNWLCSIREIAEMVAVACKKGLDIDIRSETPEKGNEFALDSALAFLRPSAEASRNRMQGVIERLFTYFDRS